MTKFGPPFLIVFAVLFVYGQLQIGFDNVYADAKACMREAVENGVSARDAYYRCER